MQAKWEKCKTLYCLRSGLMHQRLNRRNENGRSKGEDVETKQKEIQRMSDQRTRRPLPLKDKKHNKTKQNKRT